ncbi:DUF2390 domain-containing protein [Thioalkalivibrio sp. ALJ24]|uniref:DUF2390 domain-containing protein n=1 Tax=Thioalkalivibrio sp. ALJ24 TaxID=545276 RepID=UPI00037DE928|nr:DUF2390 domain-containing protein [Thioalkalivibrio sp. ALJ24]
MPEGHPAPEFWAFAETVWAHPPLRRRLLQWQDHHDADVILVLFAAWHPGPLTSDELARLRTRARDWSARATTRIRRLRRHLHTPERHALYRALLDLELSAERLGALHLLQECPPPIAVAGPHRRACADTIEARLGHLQPELPPDERASGSAELAAVPDPT